MRVYFIDTPSYSSSFSTLYDRKLEVFSGIFEGSAVIADKMYRYSEARSKWYEPNVKSIGKPAFVYRNTKVVIHDTLPELDNILNNTLFSTKELAILAKATLLERMKNKIRKELERIMEDVERKLPDSDKAIKHIKKDYPELFI